MSQGRRGHHIRRPEHRRPERAAQEHRVADQSSRLRHAGNDVAALKLDFLWLCASIAWINDIQTLVRHETVRDYCHASSIRTAMPQTRRPLDERCPCLRTRSCSCAVFTKYT